MGLGIEVISGGVSSVGATITAWTVCAGNSLQVRSAPIDSKVWLIGAWGFNQTAGVLRIRSPRLHDFVQGIRLRMSSGDAEPLFPTSTFGTFAQFLIPQDTLTVEQSGSAAAIDVGSLLLYYDNLPGINARLIDLPTLKKVGVNIIGQEVSITTGTTIAYTGQVAINSTNDNFKANTDYALLGAMVDTRVGTLRIQGIDVGNLGIGIPGEPTQRHVTADWFCRLSNATGKPCIPVFNSANKTGILVDMLGNNAAITSVATFFMVELQAGAVPLAKAGP